MLSENNSREDADSKKLLREQMISWRENLEEQDVIRQSAAMGQILLEMLANNQKYFSAVCKNRKPTAGLYYAFRNEADFSHIWRQLLQLGWDLAFPLINENKNLNIRPEKRMVFIRAPFSNCDNDISIMKQWFVEGHFGVQVPPSESSSLVCPDLLILPGLAFDRNGGRLGWGKAYYDIYLSTSAASDCDCYPLTISAAMEGQLISHVPCQNHDVLADGILTPDGIIRTARFPDELNI